MNTINTLHFLDRLRANTADSHKNLENLSVSVSIMSPMVTPEAYAHYLQLMRVVVNDTETHIFPLLQTIFPDLEERRKLTWIDNDLRFLNAETTSTKNIFTADETPSVAAAMGILYVVEGSSLGGRFILKNLQSVLGYETQGLEYFNGYGNKTGSSWKNFLNILTAYEAQYNNGEVIIAGADFAFQAIHKHFSGYR